MKAVELTEVSPYLALSSSVRPGLQVLLAYRLRDLVRQHLLFSICHLHSD